MLKKVKITIKKGNYNKSVKDGCEYIAVDCSASAYGCGSPCDTEEEVKDAIEHAKEMIRSKGDIPMVEDLREKKELTEWLK